LTVRTVSPRQPSAGILLYRYEGRELRLLLVHPGGPFWRNKDDGAWQIPKGAIDEGEAPELAALREVKEEIGLAIDGPLLALGAFRQAGGKQVHLFAAEAEFDPASLVSNRFEMEWPPRSGRMQSFPEIDRALWFDVAIARQKMLASQHVAIDRLCDHLAATGRLDPSGT
jgi:predicted NUDIX family NTP pyrophosphohydrolase